MQHTEIYDLNLIQPDDTFSPDPLNENTQLLEGAITAEAAHRQDADDALSQRIQVFEAHHFRIGTYTCVEGESLTVNVGFTPLYVFAFTGTGGTGGVLYRHFTNPYINSPKIITNGFQIPFVVKVNGTMNMATTYIYVAFD